MSVLLRAVELTKSFGAVRALRGVSFELQPGEVHAVLGENGAGKSTLIKIITGAHQADGGRLEIFGQAVEHLTPARSRSLGVACVYQQPALFPDLTIAENIALRIESASTNGRVPWAQWRMRASKILKRIGADLDPDTEVRSLSMPEQQLVEIACAVGSEARVVIMDEPTASLTQKEQHLLFAVVRELRKRGAGVIYISHRLEEIFALADRVTVLRDGESVGTNRIDDLTESELIRMMVGREMSLGTHRGTGAPGDAVLALRGLGAGMVRDIHLEVRAGEVVGLAGLVGAGRTELARMLFGINPAERGEIFLTGKAVTIRNPSDAVKLGVAYVPEDRHRHGILLEMPIEQNISMAVHPRLFPQGWLRFGAERKLALNFMEKLHVKAAGPEALGRSLSGGNQQKIALARWLATRPKVLILDEPTQGVDIGAKSEIHRIIRALADQGLAVILISSDLPEILSMSDRIVVMRNGTVVATLPGGADAHEVMGFAFGQTSEDAA
ncbi:MAG: sugar ABC transporter ATP-binding protein [Chthoniobacteraceae bacterium]